ncbi:chaperone protein dnaJ 11, chloroplastic-like [Prosopis cineraria]|uniref:chaperone protein dnaJ 11, chloroplastic-like n=1 Tax=Prosopis cineraria TaxID=364024 RepID=UPI00240F4B16|nr:chaperone protein dnaJ 11, chloroplastic-like [Prosopis cineraria]
MSLTLNLPLPAGQSLRSSSYPAASLRFLRRLPVKSSKKCRASIGAVATEADPAVIDSRRSLSLYEVLRVNQNASPTEIKSAYRSLAKLYHPDSAVRRSESDGRDFIAIHNAYETLSDPSARALYDLSLKAARRRRRPNLSSVRDRSSGFYTTRRWETDQCW